MGGWCESLGERFMQEPDDRQGIWMAAFSIGLYPACKKTAGSPIILQMPPGNFGRSLLAFQNAQILQFFHPIAIAHV